MAREEGLRFCLLISIINNYLSERVNLNIIKCSKHEWNAGTLMWCWMDTISKVQWHFNDGAQNNRNSHFAAKVKTFYESTGIIIQFKSNESTVG